MPPPMNCELFICKTLKFSCRSYIYLSSTFRLQLTLFSFNVLIVNQTYGSYPNPLINSKMALTLYLMDLKILKFFALMTVSAAKPSPTEQWKNKSYS
jgi:hypothetical protein